ncbi:alpha/beta hydrolase-fold protein [Parafilimonas sp.]|uniref:alpha/beta hydrolase-fold protein n=1 Tax=Parafilimonas sp. TaxID=1969739 RepID=UPI0039E41585
MRKTPMLIVLLAISFGAQAQSDNKIVIGKIDSIYSNILKEQRKIWIYTPDMTGGAYDSSKHYPVVYLLDGDAHFASVTGLIQQLSQVNGNTIYPEMIIVAIPNTDRTRDLTPTHVVSDLPVMDSNFSKTSGGGENFAAFIEKELMPHIDSTCPVLPYKVLIGHSFGGLTVMNILANHTALFNAYIAIDPSMWYDKERFLAATEKKLADKKYGGIKLFIGIANTMPEGMTLDKVKKDTSEETRHIRSIFALDKCIKANSQNGLKYASKYYDNDDHGSVPLISEYDGLRFIFDYYRLALTSKDFFDSSAGVVTKFKKHYAMVSEEMGINVLPPESPVNELGYFSLEQKYYAKAAALFEMNMANYPNSNNVYDAYGDMLAAKKDTGNAIVYYKKALALKDVAETKQKLNALEGKEVFALTQQQLQQYAGDFEIENVMATVTLVVRENALWAIVPGRDDTELMPVAQNIFTVKNRTGYKVVFEMDGNKVTGFTSTQPDGVFKAHIKK